MGARAVVKVYAIAEIGRCPRCLALIDLPLAEIAEGKLSNEVCPHCEAVVGVREVRFNSAVGEDED